MFLSRLIASDLRTETSKPRNFAGFCAFVINVFSCDSSSLRFSSIYLVMSDLILTHSALLPITPMRKSSAYLTYRSLLYVSSILSLLSIFCLSRLSFSYSSLSCNLTSASCMFLMLLRMRCILSLSCLYSLVMCLSFPLLKRRAYSSIYLSKLSR